MLILLVAVGAVAVLIWGGSSTPAAVAPTAPTASPTTAAPSTPSTASTDAGDQAPLTSAPAAAWTLLYGTALPTSTSDGPTTRQGAVWSGWNHTATGALMAAAYLMVATDGPDAGAVMRNSAVEGPAAQAYESEVEANPRTVSPGSGGAISGFRFATYSESAARIEFALTAPGITASVPIDLAWVDGDWRIDFERTGAKPAVTVLQGTDPAPGFVPWSAQ